MPAGSTFAGLKFELLGVHERFLRALFAALEEEGVRYCVLHGWDRLPVSLDGDLDLAAHPADSERLGSALRALEQHGFRLVHQTRSAPKATRRVFAWFEGRRFETAALNVLYEHRAGGRVLAHGDEMTAGRKWQGGYWAAAPAAEFRYLLAQQTSNAIWPEKGKRRLRELILELGPARAESAARRLFGREARAVVAACQRGDVGDSPERWKRALARAQRSRWGSLLRPVPERVRRAAAWLAPPGFSLAIVGPGDAAAALIPELLSQLARVFPKGLALEFPPRQPPGASAPRSANGATRPGGPGPLRSAARILLLAGNHWRAWVRRAYPVLARGGLVVWSHHPAGLVMDPARWGYRGPRWLAWALSRLVPQPEATLVLDVQPRQPAGSDARGVRRAYLEFALRCPGSYLVRAGEALEETAAEALRIVVGHLALRNRPRAPAAEPGQRFAGRLDAALAGLTGGKESAALEGAGRRHAFAVLPSVRHARVLAPLNNRWVAAAGMKIYTPYEPAARLVRGAVFLAVRMGWRGKARDRVLIEEDHALPLERLAAEVFREPEPVFSLLLGAGPARKLTIQVMRPDGEVLGYVKLPLTVEAAGPVRREARLLERLADVPGVRTHIPRVLFAGSWGDRYLLAQGACPGRPGPLRLSQEHRRFVEALVNAGPVDRPGRQVVAETAQAWRRASQDLETKWRELGEAALERASGWIAGASVRCGPAHGDFAPWNTRWDRGRLAVFDWESAEEAVPAGYDLFHFETEVAARLGRHRPPAAGLTARSMYLLYLVWSISRLLERGSGGREIGFRWRALAREMTR